MIKYLTKFIRAITVIFENSTILSLILFVNIALLILAGYKYIMKFTLVSSYSKLATEIMVATIGVIFVVATIGLLLKEIFQYFFIKREKHSTLQTRIIIAFSFISTVPTIIVAIFATYIFNYSIQSWFNQKILNILDESVIVTKSYIEDHTIQLKETALSLSNDFSDMYYTLINDPTLTPEVLNAQAQMRSLDEAIIFQSSTNTIIAQTPLSFSLSFAVIPKNLIELANQGKIVQIKSDPTKIRMLIKLPEYKNTYLLIGRLIDRKIINHIDATKGAVQEYYNLKDDIISAQIQFLMLFIFLSLLLLSSSVIFGVIISRQIVKPIKKLVIATEKAKSGDLTVQVDIADTKLPKDEVMILTGAFNRMIRQINLQHKDLIIAQRALAWSDVARRVAHEIKNPLTPIQLASERLLQKFEGDVVDKNSFRKYIQTILNHSKDIEKIVVEFVNFARLPLPKFAQFEITGSVRELVGARKLINENIDYKFSSNKPEILFIGDVGQLNQIILNLIKNSEEALDTTKKNKMIKVSIEEKNEEIIIYIQDNGPGFPKYLIEKAAEAYVTTRPKGMGLGLAIVKKIVQDHLGAMEIYNLENIGSEIKLIFNLTELQRKLNKI